MRHLKKGRKLSRNATQRKALLTSLACAIVENRSIRTTDTKAKELRPFIEKMVTFAKRGDVHARRQVFRRLKDKTVVKKLFEEIAPAFAKREGGYTRIIKLGNRHGDNAPVSLIEFLGTEKKVKTGPKKKPTEKAAKKKAREITAPAEEKAGKEGVAVVQVEDSVEEPQREEKSSGTDAPEDTAADNETSRVDGEE